MNSQLHLCRGKNAKKNITLVVHDPVTEYAITVKVGILSIHKKVAAVIDGVLGLGFLDVKK